MRHLPRTAASSPIGNASVPLRVAALGLLHRLRQSDMRWTTDGADAITALRCREASSTWEAICNTPHTQTRTA